MPPFGSPQCARFLDLRVDRPASIGIVGQFPRGGGNCSHAPPCMRTVWRRTGRRRRRACPTRSPAPVRNRSPAAKRQRKSCPVPEPPQPIDASAGRRLCRSARRPGCVCAELLVNARTRMPAAVALSVQRRRFPRDGERAKDHLSPCADRGLRRDSGSRRRAPGIDDVETPAPPPAAAPARQPVPEHWPISARGPVIGSKIATFCPDAAWPGPPGLAVRSRLRASLTIDTGQSPAQPRRVRSRDKEKNARGCIRRRLPPISETARPPRFPALCLFPPRSATLAI